MGTLGHKLRVFDDPGTRFRGRWSLRSNYTPTNLAFTKKKGSYQGIFTLVHEMAHAFLDCYSYAIISRLKLRAQKEYLGLTGHGPAWCNAMSVIQKALERELQYTRGDADIRKCKKAPVSFGIESGIKKETKKSSWKPTKYQLEPWGLPDSVQENLGTSGPEEENDDQLVGVELNSCRAIL
jgi:hypothetical protein